MLPTEPPDGRSSGGGDKGNDLCAVDSEQSSFLFVSPPKTCGPDALTSRRSAGDFNFFSGCERAEEADVTSRALAVSSSYVAPISALQLPAEEGTAKTEETGDAPKSSDQIRHAQVEPEKNDAPFFPSSGANGLPQCAPSLYYPSSSPYLSASECGPSHAIHFSSPYYASSALYGCSSASYCLSSSASYPHALTPPPYCAPAPNHVPPLSEGATCASVPPPNGGARGGSVTGEVGVSCAEPAPPACPPSSSSGSSPFSPLPFWAGPQPGQVHLAGGLEAETRGAPPPPAYPVGAASCAPASPVPHAAFVPSLWTSSVAAAPSAPQGALDLPQPFPQNPCSGGAGLASLAVPPSSVPTAPSLTDHASGFPAGVLHASAPISDPANACPSFSPAVSSAAATPAAYPQAPGVSANALAYSDRPFPLASAAAPSFSAPWPAQPLPPSSLALPTVSFSEAGPLPCSASSAVHFPAASASSSSPPSPLPTGEAPPAVHGAPAPAGGSAVSPEPSTDGELPVREGRDGDGKREDDKSEGKQERAHRARTEGEVEGGSLVRRSGLRIASRFPPALSVSPDAACALLLTGPASHPQEEERAENEGRDAAGRTKSSLGLGEDSLSSFSSILLYLAAGRLQAEGEDELSSAVYRHLIKSRQKAAPTHLPSCHNWKGEVRFLVPEESAAVLPHRLRPASQRWSLAVPSRGGFDGDRSEDGCLLGEGAGRRSRGRSRWRGKATSELGEAESPTQQLFARDDLQLKGDMQLFLADLVALLASRVPGHLSVREFLRWVWPPHLAVSSVSSERPREVGDASSCDLRRHEGSALRPTYESYSSSSHLRACQSPFSSGSSSSLSGSSSHFSFSRNLFLLNRSGRFSRALLPPPRASVPSCSDCHTLSSGFFLSGAARALLPLSSPLLLSSSLVKASSTLGSFPCAVSPAAAAAFASGAGAQAATAVGAAAGPWLAWSRKVKRVANVWGHQISHEELLSGERPALDNQFQIGLVREPAAVYVVRYDATGSVVFTGGDDGLIKAWDAATGQLVYALVKHQGDITDIDLHPNNSLLLSGCGKGEVRLWRVLPAGWIPICAMLVPERVAWARFLPERHCESEREKHLRNEDGSRRSRGLPEEDAARGENKEPADDTSDRDSISLVIVGCDDRKIRFYDLCALLETPPAGGPGGRTTVSPLLEADWGAPLLPRAMDLSKVPLDASGSFLLALGLEAPSEPSSGNETGDPAPSPAVPTDSAASSVSVPSCSLVSSRHGSGQSDGGVHTRSASSSPSPPSSAFRALVVRTPSFAHLRCLRLRREEEERQRRERRCEEGGKMGLTGVGVAEDRGLPAGGPGRDEGRRRTRFGGEAKSKVDSPDKPGKFPSLLFADLTPFHSSFPDVCFAWHSPDLVTGGDDGNLFFWAFSSLSGGFASSSPYLGRLRQCSSTRRGALELSASSLSSHKFFLLSLSVQRLLEGRYLPGGSGRSQPSSAAFPCSLFADSASPAPGLSPGPSAVSGSSLHAFSPSPFSSLAHLAASRQGGRVPGGRVQARAGGPSGRHSSSSSISSSSSDSSGESDLDGEANLAHGRRGRRGRPTVRPSGSRLSRRHGPSSHCGGFLARASPQAGAGGPGVGSAFGQALQKELEIFSAGVGDQPRLAADASGVRYSLLALAFSCDDALVCVADAVSRKTSKARIETMKPVDQSLSFFPSASSASGPLKACRVGSVSLQRLSEGLVSQLKPHPSCPLLLLCSTFSGEVLLLDVSEAHARARAGMGNGVTFSTGEDCGPADGLETEETAHLERGNDWQKTPLASGRDQGRRYAFGVAPCAPVTAEKTGARAFASWNGDTEEKKYTLPWHWEGGCTVLRKLRFGSQCSWLDMAWAPNGLQFAGTHRLGCLSIFAHGSSPLFEVTLFEQFLSSESRDTRRDAASLFLTDAGTRQAPHLLSRGILLDAARQPYPLHLQPSSLVLPLLSVGCRNAHLYMCLRCLRRRLPGALRRDAVCFLRKMYSGEKHQLSAPFASLRISACPCCPGPEKAWQFGDPFKCPFCYGDSSLGVGAERGSEAGRAEAGPERGDGAQLAWGGVLPEALEDPVGLHAPRAQHGGRRQGGAGDRSLVRVGEGERERRLRRLEGRLAAQLAEGEGDRSMADAAGTCETSLPPTSHLALRLECLLRRLLRREAANLLRCSQQQKTEEQRALPAPVAAPVSPAASDLEQGEGGCEGGEKPAVGGPGDGKDEEKVDRQEGEGERARERAGEAEDGQQDPGGAIGGNEDGTRRDLCACLEDGNQGAEAHDRERGEKAREGGRDGHEEKEVNERTRDGNKEGRITGCPSAVPTWDDEEDFSLSEEEGQRSEASGWIEEEAHAAEAGSGGMSSGGHGYWSTTDVAVNNEARRLEVLHKHRLEHHCIWKLHRCSSRGNILILRSFATALLQGRRMPAALVRPPLEDDAWLTQVNWLSSVSSFPMPPPSRQQWGRPGAGPGGSASRVSPPSRQGVRSRRARDRDEEDDEESDSDFELQGDEPEGPARLSPSTSSLRPALHSGGASGASTGPTVSRSGRVVGFRDLQSGRAQAPPVSSRVSSRGPLRRVADLQPLSSSLFAAGASHRGGSPTSASGRPRRRGSRWRLMPDEGWTSENSSEEAEEERERRGGRRSCRLAGESTVDPRAMLQDPTLPSSVQRVLRQLLDDDELKQLRQHERQNQKDKQARESKKHAARDGATAEGEEDESLWDELPSDRIDAEGREQHVLFFANVRKSEEERDHREGRAGKEGDETTEDPKGENAKDTEDVNLKCRTLDTDSRCLVSQSPAVSSASSSALVPVGLRRSERAQNFPAPLAHAASACSTAGKAPRDATEKTEDCVLCAVPHRCELCDVAASCVTVPDWRFINTLEDFDEGSNPEEDRKAFHSRLLAGEIRSTSLLHLVLGELVGPFFFPASQESLGGPRGRGTQQAGTETGHVRGEPRRRARDENGREREAAGTWVHVRCLMAVSDLDVDCHARGFNNLKARIDEARSHHCTFCNARGPTVQCTFCPRVFHYPCSLKSYLASGLTAQQLGLPSAAFTLPSSAVSLPSSSFCCSFSTSFSSTSYLDDTPALNEARAAAFAAAAKLQPHQRTRCLPDPLYYGRYVCVWCRKSRQMKTLLAYLTGEIFLSVQSRHWLAVSHRCSAGFISSLPASASQAGRSLSSSCSSCSSSLSSCTCSSHCRVRPLPPLGCSAAKKSHRKAESTRVRSKAPEDTPTYGAAEAKKRVDETSEGTVGDTAAGERTTTAVSVGAGRDDGAKGESALCGSQTVAPEQNAKRRREPPVGGEGTQAGIDATSGYNRAKSEGGETEKECEKTSALQTNGENGGKKTSMLESVVLPPADDIPCCFSSVGVYVPQLGDVLRYFPHLHQNPVLPHDRVQLWQPELFLPCDVLVTNISYEFPGLPVDEEPVAIFAVLELSVVRPECLYGRRFEVHFAPSLDGEADYLVPLLDVNRGLLRLAQLREGEDCRAYMDGKFYTARVEEIKRRPDTLLTKAFSPAQKPHSIPFTHPPFLSSSSASISGSSATPATSSRPCPSILAGAAAAARAASASARGPRDGESEGNGTEEQNSGKGEGRKSEELGGPGLPSPRPSLSASCLSASGGASSSPSLQSGDARDGGSEDGMRTRDGSGQDEIDGALAIQASLASFDWPVFPTPGVVNCAHLRLREETMTQRVQRDRRVGQNAASLFGNDFFVERSLQQRRWMQTASLGLEAIRVHYYSGEEDEKRASSSTSLGSGEGSGDARGASRRRGKKDDERGRKQSSFALSRQDDAERQTEDQEQWLNAWEVDFPVGERDRMHAELQWKLQEAEFPRARQLELFAALDALMMMQDTETNLGEDGEPGRDDSVKKARRRGDRRRRRGRPRKRRAAADNEEREDEDEDEEDEGSSASAIRGPDAGGEDGKPEGDDTHSSPLLFELFLEPIETIGETRGARRGVPSWLERYWKEVPLPISLALIRERLWNGFYRREPALHFDFHLLLYDCRLFNPPGDPVHTLSYRLEEELIRQGLLPKALLNEKGTNARGKSQGMDRGDPEATQQNLLRQLRRHAETQLVLAGELEERIQLAAIQWVKERKPTPESGTEEGKGSEGEVEYGVREAQDERQAAEGRRTQEDERREEDEKRRKARLRRFEGTAENQGSLEETNTFPAVSPPGSSLKHTRKASQVPGISSSSSSVLGESSHALVAEQREASTNNEGNEGPRKTETEDRLASTLRAAPKNPYPSLASSSSWATSSTGGTEARETKREGDADVSMDETAVSRTRRLPQDGCSSRKRLSPEEIDFLSPLDESRFGALSPADRTKRARTLRDFSASSSGASASCARAFPASGDEPNEGCVTVPSCPGAEAAGARRRTDAEEGKREGEADRGLPSRRPGSPVGVHDHASSAVPESHSSGRGPACGAILGTTRSGRVIKRSALFSDYGEGDEQERARGSDRERKTLRCSRDESGAATMPGRSATAGGGGVRRGRRQRSTAQREEGDEAPRDESEGGEDELKKALALSVQTYKEEQERKTRLETAKGSGRGAEENSGGKEEDRKARRDEEKERGQLNGNTSALNSAGKRQNEAATEQRLSKTWSRTGKGRDEENDVGEPHADEGTGERGDLGSDDHDQTELSSEEDEEEDDPDDDEDYVGDETEGRRSQRKARPGRRGRGGRRGRMHRGDSARTKSTCRTPGRYRVDFVVR
ncbi:putative WD repeat domain-containing protein [Neospora caninum Liverpool]|uniref:Putative WD repeat domain-containing protein n=1 Tax=Neospora caninum (strain Liverpool) TaxID=572307 RepID=F0VN20_NEOCL|nr:putative WD repeat domain-containing protein [Neospora caninum Liverpool]CBZ55116.1 putative WD repeat domain-containing protein [Neospora caninum Liverpool]|eukprot:XP_003885144.1 putative WD repeat domain-containing protein [Neospora caninum Liverpool]